jgi:hypothetical protein
MTLDLNERKPENTGMIKRIVQLMLSIKHLNVGDTGYEDAKTAKLNGKNK